MDVKGRITRCHAGFIRRTAYHKSYGLATRHFEAHVSEHNRSRLILIGHIFVCHVTCDCRQGLNCYL